MLSSDNDEVIQAYLHTSRSTDEYIHEPYWRVVLSDDRLVYSYRGRRSWLELRSYLAQNPSIYIKELSFGFRDHIETVHSGAADYFFVHSVLADYGSGWEIDFYVGGYRDGDKVICKKFRIPEIFLVEESSRGLDDISVQRGLIERNFLENNNTCEQTGVATQ
jgi:hypothetical protein